MVDSNLDWGENLKRLKDWMTQIKCTDPGSCQKIDKIYIVYFGGGDLQFYLGAAGIEYEIWDGKNDPEQLPKGSYLAVSATQLQGGRAVAVKGYDQATDYYEWLNDYTPVAQIGYGIFVYKIN